LILKVIKINSSEGFKSMKFIKRNAVNIGALLACLLVGLSAAAALGQEGKLKEKRSFCSGNSSWGDSGVSFKELRELSAPARTEVSVDGSRNGGITVIGEDRSDILVRACVQAHGSTEEAAKAAASNIRISLDGTIKAESSSGDDRWAVSFELRVPRNSNLSLQAKNGGIHVRSVDGSIVSQTVNGGLHLDSVSGSVRGRTVNGGVHLGLSGTSWRGSGLDLETTNGGIHLKIPANFAARVEASTVNGGFHSDFPGLQPERDAREKEGFYRHKPTRINAAINGGGQLVRVSTTNGGVHIQSLDD
jgi:hypothetical protein